MSFVLNQSIYHNKKFSTDKESILKNSDIIDYYRKIFIFIDKNNYLQNKYISIAKIFQINCSVSKTNSNPFSRNGDFIKFNINMYSFDTEIRDLKQPLLDDSLCVLKEAYSNDSYYDSTRDIYSTENQLLYDNNKSINNPFLKESFIDMEYNSFDVIPEPIYYTSNHQFMDTGECPEPLNSIYAPLIYRFKELRDNKTIISCLDIEKYLSFKEEKIRKLRKADMFTYENHIDISSIISDLFYHNAETLLEGLVFSYDSLIGEVNIHNVKRWPVTMGFSTYKPEKIQFSHIMDMKNIIKNQMKVLEKDHGNLLFLYCPFSHGDRFDLHFRDYEKTNQPISCLSSDDVDKNYSLNTIINDCILDISDY